MPSIKDIFVFLVVFLFAFWVSFTDSDAATINAASPSYFDVSAAVSTAQPGDTVIVPAGSAVWASSLTITKGITLQGAGINKTTITAGLDGVNKTGQNDELFFVVYRPETPANNEAFRLTGFTFDCDGRIQALKLDNQTLNKQTKIRIDHNKFINGRAESRFILIKGTIYGVMDNNYINKNATGNQIADFYNGIGAQTWANYSYSYGTSEAFFFEDNTCVITDGTHDMAYGARAIVRYNHYEMTYSAGNRSFFQMHGAQCGGNYAPMGVEYYGNDHTAITGGSLNGMRGGKALMFFNKVTAPGRTFDINVNNWYPDNAPENCCPPNYNCGTNFITAPDGQPQHISNSYFWNNKCNSLEIGVIFIKDCCLGLPPGDHGPWPDCCIHGEGNPSLQANSEWWEYKTSFDGTVGVGCGTLASRPATCTTGVGYWATNQSCSDLTGMVGKNPATPISGTLYKCTSPNIWTPYYTPYTYPHPLRKGETPLSPPTGLTILSQ